MMDSTTKDRILRVIALVSLILVWYAVALRVGNDLKLPSPKATFLSMLEILKEPEFIFRLLSTAYRGIISLIASLVLAILLGFVAGFNTYIELFMEPVIRIIRSSPTIALIFIFLTAFKSGITASIYICIFVVFPILYSNVLKGVQQVNHTYLEMAKIYDVPRKRIYKDIYLPSIGNFILAGITASIGLNFKVMIAAEVIGEVKNSMGKSIYLANINLDKPAVFAWCILLIIMVYIIELLWNGFMKKGAGRLWS